LKTLEKEKINSIILLKIKLVQIFAPVYLFFIVIGGDLDGKER